MARKNKEFERSRQDVLRMAREMDQKRKADAPVNQDQPMTQGDRKFAWEYEILEYRRRRKIERFLIVGAMAGIMSLIITLTVNYGQIVGLFN